MGIVTTHMSAISFSAISTMIFAVQGPAEGLAEIHQIMLPISQIRTVSGMGPGKNIARSSSIRSVEPRFGPPCEPLKASLAALAALPAEKQTLKRLAELHVRHCDEHGRA